MLFAVFVCWLLIGVCLCPLFVAVCCLEFRVWRLVLAVVVDRCLPFVD